MNEPIVSKGSRSGEGRSSPGRLLLRFLMSVALAYFVVALTACFFQRRLIYFPLSGPVELPSHPRYAGLTEVALRSADGVNLKGWYWPPSPAIAERQLAILVLHGNAGHREHRLDWLECLHRTGAAVLIIDYRGFGGSEGSPSEEGLYLDAEAGAAWLADRGAGRLVYLGESLGTGVAVELARRRPPRALILQSPFTSMVEVAKFHYSWLPVRLMLRERYDVVGKLPEIGCPVLVIHGGKDSVVPTAMGRKVFESAREPKEWLEIPGADHNDALWDDPSYSPRLKDFLEL